MFFGGWSGYDRHSTVQFQFSLETPPPTPRSKREKQISAPSLLSVQIISTVTPPSDVSEFEWRDIKKEIEKAKNGWHTRNARQKGLWRESIVVIMEESV